MEECDMPHQLFRPPFRRALTPGALLGLFLLAAQAYAADTVLKEVVVTATRTETEADAVPATITSLGREEIDRRLPTDDADLFADEPDVAMPRDLRRHGATRVNIRGIEDNRVIQLLDGVRLPDYYNGGGPTNFTMSAMPTAMPDFLKRVEVLRGPSSSLYGSDAIGGVVGYFTLDPVDIAGDKAQGLRYRATYQGANDATTHTVLGAFRGESAEVLLGYSGTRGHEYDNKGTIGGSSPTRTEPNPQRVRDDGLLAKLILRPAAGHKLTATLEGRKQSATTDVLRLSASLPRVTAMDGDDNNRRVRGSIEWEHKPASAALYDRLTVRLYRQDAETKNHNFQRRTNTTAGCSASIGGSNNCEVDQDFFFSQETLGGGLQAEKQLQAGGLTHLLTFGTDLSRVRVEQLRDATIRNLTTGVTTKTLAGESYPLRDFAIGRTDTLGVFVQDEIIGLAGDRLTLIPGLRYDRTRLKPEMDALAQQVLTLLGRSAVEQSHGALSPKLGATWKFDPALSAYGQIARGFRAPNYEEVNGAFLNTTQRYGTVPNPDLKPETSLGVELGLRHITSTHRLQFAVFDNRYRDFIESVRLTCPGNPACITTPGFTTFQSVNLSRVRIYGAEARGAWTFAPGWLLQGAIAWAHGTDEESGQPLESIEPARLTLALVRDVGRWGGEARLLAATKKSRVPQDPADPWFKPPGYGVVNLSAWYQVHKNARLTVAVKNLFDKKYYLWSDIRQADARNPAGVDFYSQPGRNLSVALQVDF
jgi:hemoglobin/transferrin/lactoferrin receptor protein